MLERDVDIAAAGSHTERIYPTEPGDYIVRVTATDDAGRTVTAASEIWVIGKGEAWWSGDDSDRMTLVASKPSYRPGDVARLVAQANLRAPTALVTVERDGILDARVTKLASASRQATTTAQKGRSPLTPRRVCIRPAYGPPGSARRRMRKGAWTWSSL